MNNNNNGNFNPNGQFGQNPMGNNPLPPQPPMPGNQPMPGQPTPPPKNPMPQSPMQNQSSIPGSSSMQNQPQINQSQMQNQPNTKSPNGPFANRSNFAWLSLGAVGVAAIFYIIMIAFIKTTDFTPFFISIFCISLVAVVSAIIFSIKKFCAWLDWRIMVTFVLGIFICLITGIYLIQIWQLQAKYRVSYTPESSYIQE